jgi:RNA polymerase sigma factor (sigma-70 family)
MSDSALQREAGVVALFVKYSELLVRVGLGQGVDAHRAKDVVSEVVIAFLRRAADGLWWPTSLISYLVTATRNRARNVRRDEDALDRRGRIWAEENLSPIIPTYEEDSEASKVAVVRMLRLHQALPMLSEKDQQVVMVVLRSKTLDTSEKDAAEAEGIPYTAFRKRKDRLFPKLRKLLGGTDGSAVREGA